MLACTFSMQICFAYTHKCYVSHVSISQNIQQNAQLTQLLIFVTEQNEEKRHFDLSLRWAADAIVLFSFKFFSFLAQVSCWEPQCLWPPCPAEAQLYLTVILLCQPESLLLAARPSRSPTGRTGRGAGVLFACLFWMCMCACVFTEGEAKRDV